MNIAGCNIRVEISASQTSNWFLNSEKILFNDSVFNWNVTVFKARWALSKGEILSSLNYSNHCLAISWVELAPVICIMNLSLSIINTIFFVVIGKIHLEIVRIRVSHSHVLSKCTNVGVISKCTVILAKKGILNYTTTFDTFVGTIWVFLQWQNISIYARGSRKNCSTTQELTILCTYSTIMDFLVVGCKVSADFCVEGIVLVKCRCAPCETWESWPRTDKHWLGFERYLFRE